jgi:hypothetical protein
MSIETLKGLYLLETLTAPVPATITQYLKDNFATGTGPYGSFTVMDFLGTAAGVNVTDLMLQVPTLIDTMDVSVLQGIYNDMLATVSGTYGPNTGPVTIPSGPAAGVYATGNLAFTTGLIPAAQAEIANLIATYPTETNNLNSAFNTISEQIFREAVNQAKTGLNYDSLPGDIQSNALSFASSLAQYGQDNTPNNASEFLNTVAQFATLPGQAIIGALREGRNYQSLNQAGILSTNFAVPSTYPGDSPGGNDTVLTPLPPVQPPIIPAPPAAQIPTNATSTDYTVDEARARIASGPSVTNSALSSTPPPVVPGAETTPMASPSPRVAPAIPPNPPEGPNVRLFRSSSRVNAGELCIIDAEVFFSAIDNYPIGTVVPYTVTGEYVSGGTVDPSLIVPSSTEGYAGRTAGYGLTPIPAGLPLNGTFRITGTRIGGFAISTSTALLGDAILTITVAGTTTYVVVMAQNPSLKDAVLDILGVYGQVLFNGRPQSAEVPSETIEVGKEFYVNVRPRPSSRSADGTIVISSGPGFSVKSRPIEIQYGDNSSSELGSTYRVPGSLIPTPGPVMITFSCSIFGSGSFFGSKVIEVTPPSFTKAVGIILGGWADDSTLRIIAAERRGAGTVGGRAEVKEGTSIAVVVTGPPDTTFTWSGFDSTGTTATDSTGRCVFPNVITPPAGSYQFDVTSPIRRIYRDYLLQVNWPDGSVSTFTVQSTPAD